MDTATTPKSFPMIVRQAGRDIISVRDALGRSAPAPVVVISGGADTLDPAIVPKLTQLIGRGLIRADQTAGAVFMDGGTDAGVTALIGRAAVTVIGVAPEALVECPDISPAEAVGGRVALAPNHTHFVT